MARYLLPSRISPGGPVTQFPGLLTRLAGAIATGMHASRRSAPSAKSGLGRTREHPLYASVVREKGNV